jgi:hypothetical protein
VRVDREELLVALVQSSDDAAIWKRARRERKISFRSVEIRRESRAAGVAEGNSRSVC